MDDADFALRWRLIKTRFSTTIPDKEWRSDVRKKRGERGISQRRYQNALFWAYTTALKLAIVGRNLKSAKMIFDSSGNHLCLFFDIFMASLIRNSMGPTRPVNPLQCNNDATLNQFNVNG